MICSNIDDCSCDNQQPITDFSKSYALLSEALKNINLRHESLKEIDSTYKKKVGWFASLHERILRVFDGIDYSKNSFLREISKLFPDIKTQEDLEKKINLILIRLMCLTLHINRLVGRTDNLILTLYIQLKQMFLEFAKNRLSLILIIKFNTEFYKSGGLAHD